MVWIKRLLIILLVLIAGVALAAMLYASSRVPAYEGELELSGIQSPVTVTFDEFGIPHIKGENAEDVYYSLGYVMASERLFQMELLRRVGTGKLSEALGEKALKADVFFRASGISDYAESSYAGFENFASAEAKKECQAFIEGINAFIASGKAPLEFTLAGIEMTPFEGSDLFAIAGYMAYSFSIAVKTDALANELAKQHGEDWVIELGLFGEDLPPLHQNCIPDSIKSLPEADLLGDLGIPVFTGSNAWAVDGSRTKSGKPMLCNDTHIGFAMPQVWYEAALEFPGMRFYGNFLPGIPYALVGHSEHHAWGLTMFENDDIDLYRERRDENGDFMYGDDRYAATVKEYTIRIKDAPDTTIRVEHSIHGPIMNDFMEVLPEFPPMAMRWEYTQKENHLIHAFRSMNTAGNLDEFEAALPDIHAPGLNVVYADIEGNIAWWAVAHLPIHPSNVNPKTVIDGSYTENDLLGYRSFDRNPHCVNPEEGFVHSANEQPERLDSLPVYGYYVPPSRSQRIASTLRGKADWDASAMKDLLTDVINDDEALIAQRLNRALLQLEVQWSELEQQCIDMLDWDGHYGVTERTPLLFQSLQVALLEAGLSDDMTTTQFDQFCETHWMRRAMLICLNDNDHPMWDVRTTERNERMSDHLEAAFRATVEKLRSELGDDPAEWHWGEQHMWQPKHPFKDVPIVGEWLNSDAYPAPGSNETVAQYGFTPGTAPVHDARYGAQMRIIVDLGDVEQSESIAPTGQSGHRMSTHYKDQAEMYVGGLFRPQHISAVPEGNILFLLPENE